MLRVANTSCGYNFRVKSGVFINDINFKDGRLVVNRRRLQAPPYGVDYHEEQLRRLTDVITLIEDVVSQTPKERRTSHDLSQSVERAMHPETKGCARRLSELIAVMSAEKGLSVGRCNSLLVVARTMERYECYVRLTEKGQEDFRLTPVTADTERVEGFLSYVRNESALCAEQPRIFAKVFKATNTANERRAVNERGENYITKYVKIMRSLFHWLAERGDITCDPMRSLKAQREHYGAPVYITIAERNRIAEAVMPTFALSVQRDIFIFQCFVGCRVGDLVTLTPANIVEGVLQYTPAKTEDTTGVTARVPLHKQALALVEKYKGNDPKGRLFPCIAPQKYNLCIKRIFKAAGITRDVEVIDPKTGCKVLRPICDVASSHMARRTFIGNAYAIVQDPCMISRMSGHSEGSRAFNRYRNVLDEMCAGIVERMG